MSVSFLISKGTALPRSEPGQFLSLFVSNSRYLLESAVSVTGFVAAVLVNVLFPQVTETETKIYRIGDLELTANLAYRIVLSGIVLLYAGLSVFSFFGPARKGKFLSRVAFRFVGGLALALWDILDTKLQRLPMPFFPGPSRIIEAFLLEGRFIFQSTLYSLRLFTVNFASGVAFGVGTGILIGWFLKVYYWVLPVLKITGVIPAVVWMPFALTLFPIPFSTAAFLIVIYAWFPVAFLTAQEIVSTPRTLFEVTRTLGVKTPYLAFHVAIPHAMPQILTDISTANGFAFITLVMSEMIGQPGGLGYYINASKVWSACYKVLAAILVMATLLSATMKMIGTIQGRVLQWQKGVVR